MARQLRLEYEGVIYLLKHYVGTTSREAGEFLGGMNCSAVAKKLPAFRQKGGVGS